MQQHSSMVQKRGLQGKRWHGRILKWSVCRAANGTVRRIQTARRMPMGGLHKGVGARMRLQPMEENYAKKGPANSLRTTASFQT